MTSSGNSTDRAWPRALFSLFLQAVIGSGPAQSSDRILDVLRITLNSLNSTISNRNYEFNPGGKTDASASFGSLVLSAAYGCPGCRQPLLSTGSRGPSGGS